MGKKDVKFADENEKDAISLLTMHLLDDFSFYDNLSRRNTPEARQDARLLISYIKGDVWALDDSKKQACERAMNTYIVRYIIEHLSKKEIAQDILAKFFADGGKTRLLKIANDRLNTDIKKAIIGRRKRIITKKDITSKPFGRFDFHKYADIFKYPDQLEFDDESFSIISEEIYSGHKYRADDFIYAYSPYDFKDYDKWFCLCKHILMTEYDYELFYMVGNMLNLIWMTIDPNDKDTNAWIEDQIFEIFWYRVSDIWERGEEVISENEKLLNDSIGWLNCLSDLEKRLPKISDKNLKERISDWQGANSEENPYKLAFKKDMRELRRVMKLENPSTDQIAEQVQRIYFDSWDRKDAVKFEKYATENIVPVVKDKKLLAYLKKTIKHVHRIAETVEIESKNIAKIREHFKDWPEYVSGSDNPEFLNEIKLEYIISAECERSDPYYDSVSSPWYMSLKLLVNGKKCSVWISDQGLYHRYYEMISNSGEFNCESEIPMQYGREVFTRKK